MKTLCSIDIGGRQLDYLLDIGRRSNAYLCVKDSVVTVRLPYGGTRQMAEEMIRSHSDWLEKKLRGAQDRSRLPQVCRSGEQFSLLGRRYLLSIEECDEYRPPEIFGDCVTVYIGHSMGEQDAARLFMRFTAELCERCVRQAFDKYTVRLGLSPRKVTIKRMKSRWGSCSSTGNISINLDVICFEQECIDYVVVHELCHLKYMNHGEDFWRLVSTCCPNYKALRERMKH